MQSLERLRKLRDMLTADIKEKELWLQFVAGSDNLVAVLRDVVDEGPSATSTEIDSLHALSNELFELLNKELALKRLRDSYQKDFIEGHLDDEDCRRVLCNARALIGTAGLAFAIRENNAPRLEQWAARAAEALSSPSVPLSVSVPPGISSVGSGSANFLSKLFAGISGALNACVQQTLCSWTLYWLAGAQMQACRVLQVPEASYNEGFRNGDGSYGLGYVTFLDLFVLDLIAGRPQGVVIEHPDMALRPVRANFLHTLEKAAQNCPFSVCWRIRIVGGELGATEYLEGKSIGAPAWAGFYMAARGLEYDPGCILIGKISERAAGEMDAVERETEKVEGVARWNQDPAHHAIRRILMAKSSTSLLHIAHAYSERGLYVAPYCSLDKAAEDACELNDHFRQHLRAPCPSAHAAAANVPALPLQAVACQRKQESRQFEAGNYRADCSLIPQNPADLRTRWGLNRGRFVGIYAGHAQHEIYDALRDTEAALRNRQMFLPCRWWMRLDWTTTRPNENNETLETVLNLWDAAEFDTDTQKQEVKATLRFGLPKRSLPAFHLTLRVEDGASPEQRQAQRWHLIGWCSVLFNLFKNVPLAIVIHVAGDYRPALQEALMLQKQLETLGEKGRFPVEGAMLSLPYPSAAKTPVGTNKRSGILKGKSSSAVGDALVEWIAAASQVPDVEDELERYATITQVVSSLDTDAILERTSSNSKAAASAVVTDCITLLAKWKEDDAALFHRQFLHLIYAYLPGDAPTLVEAYAEQADDIGRRCALALASKSDVLMDAWVRGTKFEQSKFPDTATIRDDPCYGPVLLALCLALRRAGGSDDADEQLKEIVSSVLDRLPCPQALRQVREFVNGALPELRTETFWSYAARVRPSATVLAPWMQQVSWREPPAWRFLFSVAPEALLPAVTAMPPIRRAVFGLCTPLEWENLSSVQRAEVCVNRGCGAFGMPTPPCTHQPFYYCR